MRRSRRAVRPVEPVLSTTYNKSLMLRQRNMQVVGTAIKVSGAHEPSFAISALFVDPHPLQGSLSSAAEVIRPLSVAFTKNRLFSKDSYPATGHTYAGAPAAWNVDQLCKGAHACRI